MSYQNEMSEQRKRFTRELETFINTMHDIDKNTPWQPREPEWWLEMMQVETKCLIALKYIKKRYGDTQDGNKNLQSI